MKTRSMFQIAPLVSCLVAFPAVGGDKPEKGGPGHKWESEDRHGHDDADRHKDRREDQRGAFSEEERRTIQVYAERYNALPGKHERRLPPGLAKKVVRGGNLPPGWEKKCVVGETMPTEVYAECHPLPNELVVKLPPPPESAVTVTVAVEGKVVRLVKATREILDVFDLQVRI
jgi:hypothetical protein